MRDVLLGEVWKVPTAQERIQNKLLSQQYQDEMDRRNELIKQANMLSGPPVMEQPMATPPEGQMLTHEQQHMQPQMPINAPSTMPIAQDAPQSTFPPQPMQTPMQNRNALAPQPQIQNYGQLQAQQQMQAMLGDQLKIVKALAESNPGAVEAYWNSNPMLKKLGSYNSEMAENGTVQHYISGPDGKPQMVGASFKVPGGKWQFVNLKDMYGEKSLKNPIDLAIKALRDEGNINPKAEEISRKVGELDRVQKGMGTPISFDAKPEDALKGVDAATASIIKKIANYQMQIPGAFALKDPKWQDILARVSLLDPDFDATQYNAKVSLKRDFMSGKTSFNIVGLNTAVGHIASLVKAAEGLKNSDWQSKNWAENFLAKNLPMTKDLKKRQGAITNAKTKFNAVTGEMASIFKASGATDQEIESWKKTIDDPATATPQQWKAFINGSLELMGSRIESINNKYEQGMGRPKDFKFMSEGSRKILKNLGVDIERLDPVVAEPKFTFGTQSQGQKQPIPAERNQNPLNIKRGGATEYLIKEGIATPGSEAKDGGNFLKFNSAEEGLEAGKKLLFDSSVYRNLTVDAAMKKWSNGAYGGNIAPQLAMKTVGSLNQQERDILVKAIIRAEGSGSVGPKSTTKGKIDRATARKYFEKYNYDKTKASAAAKRDGYEVD
jgi:hypothetical protein